ncbi:MAG: class I SAM-dependent methyltransferase [Planctomycetia bacterium]|nr:class I SAM-dependent methyltransferase [Planctomycetia bacterium]
MPGPNVLDPVQRTYDRLAVKYDERWRFYIEASLELVLAGLEIAGNELILDLACGTGELERQLLTRAPRLRILGVDLSHGMLANAQKKNVAGRAVFLQAESHHLPISSKTFDVVICANAFHYFRGAQESLNEIRRVLKPDGKLILLDWCDDYLSCKLCSIWLRWTDPAFYRTYTLAECTAQLEQAEFRVLQAKRGRVGWIWGMMRLACEPAPNVVEC